MQELLDVKILKKFILDNNMEQLAYRSFWKNLQSYNDEQKDIYNCLDVNEVVVEIQSVSLKYGNWSDCNYNHIVISMPIVYKEKVIGKYEILFTFEGEVDNDYFVIY